MQEFQGVKENYRIEVNLQAPLEDVKFILDQIIYYNRAHFKTEIEHFTVSLRDDHKSIVGGAVIYVLRNEMIIDLLWVAEKLRHKGYGTMLIQSVESEALTRQCTRIILDTYDFQAPKFYEKCGFVEHGRIKDYLQGADKISFQKYL